MDGREEQHRRALEALYVAHERGLYNAAFRYVWSADEARDVVQDAFVRLWSKREVLDWERATGLAYRMVLGIAANRRRAARVRGWFRGGKDEPPAPEALHGGAVADELLASARMDADVRASIDALPERLRSVLVMCMFSELDYAEIGLALGIAPGTVGSRRNEAVAQIRARLGGADVRSA